VVVGLPGPPPACQLRLSISVLLHRPATYSAWMRHANILARPDKAGSLSEGCQSTGGIVLQQAVPERVVCRVLEPVELWGLEWSRVGEQTIEASLFAEAVSTEELLVTLVTHLLCAAV
jgi:hypothetical protein